MELDLNTEASDLDWTCIFFIDFFTLFHSHVTMSDLNMESDSYTKHLDLGSDSHMNITEWDLE